MLFAAVLGLFGALASDTRAAAARAAAAMAAEQTSLNADQSTLHRVRRRGYLRCGVSKDALGFSLVDSAGRWSGLGVDFCVALSVAVFGNRDAVKFVPLSAAGRFTAVQNRDVDVLIHNTTWTLGRDATPNLQFVAPLFFGGTKLLVRLKQNVESALELAGASVCTLAGSASEQNTAGYFLLHKMRHEIVSFDKWSDAVEAYQAKRCQALAGDVITLARQTLKIGGANEHMLLPEFLAVDMLGPAVRTGDDVWFKIVRWTVAAMIRGEELALTSSNVDAMRGKANPVVRGFLGLDARLGRSLWLSDDWTYQIIKQVGNYGESFARNFGAGSKLKLDRALNNLWSKGGLLVAPHFR